MNFFHQPSNNPIVRSAKSSDVDDIFGLIESMTADGTLLRDSLYESEQQLNTSIVAASRHGLVPGLRRPRRHVAEVPSIAVRPQARGLKAGSKLLPYLRYLTDERRE